MTYEELIESLASMVSRIEDEGKFGIEKIQIDPKYRHYAGDYVNNPDQITMFMGYPCEFVNMPEEMNYLIHLEPVVLDEVYE